MATQSGIPLSQTTPRWSPLAPGSWLMDRLRFRSKFLLLGLLLVAPMVYLFWSHLSDERASLRDTRREIQGVRYIRPAWQVMIDINKPWLDTSQATFDPIGDEAFRDGFSLIPWREKAIPPGESHAMPDGMLALIESYVDQSLLILDPEMHTYYLMELGTRTLPRLMADIKFLRWVQLHQNPVAAAVHLSNRKHTMAIAWTQLERCLDVLERADPEAAAALRPLAADARLALTTWKESSADPAFLPALRDRVDTIFRAAADLLENRLAARVANRESHVAFVSAVAAGAIALAFYGALCSYHSVRRSVRALSETTARLERGDMSAHAELTSSDELTDVGHAFNRVVAQLQDKWADAIMESQQRATAEEDVRKAQQRLLAMTDATPAFIWESDTHGTLTFINGYWSTFTGVADLKHLAAKWFDFVHPDDVSDVRDAWNSAVATHQPFSSRYRLRRADGAYRWLLDQGTPRQGPTGEPIGHVGCMLDIHDQLEAQERIELERQRMETACDGAGVGVWDWDCTSGRLLWSRAMHKLTGVDPLNFRQHFNDFMPIIHRDDVAIVDEAVKRSIASPDRKGHARFRVTRPDGATRSLDGAWVVLGEPGKNLRILGINRDVTEEVESRRIIEQQTRDVEEARDQARAASKAKSDFLANMSHEIRTPMNAIIGFTDLLTDPNLPHEQHEDAILTVRRNGQHLLQIVNDILDLTRVEAGRITINKSPCSIAAVVANVESLMRVHAREKKLDLVVEVAANVPASILSDQGRLRQILVNLVGNAIKFTQVGAVRIAVRYDADTSALSIDVRDSGIGIAPEVAARLFKPFTQADESMSRRFGGAGLGLAISAQFAQLLNGSIRVDSTPNIGSTFTLTLESVEIAAVAQQPVASTPVEQRLIARVLLVEDGPDNQRLISFHLKKAGADVTIAENGRAALDIIERERDQGRTFDIIFMDMQMPEMDGYTATQILRRRGDSTPILALTAHAMVGDREKCLAVGCDDYLTKPTNKTALVDAATRWLQKRSSVTA